MRMPTHIAAVSLFIAALVLVAAVPARSADTPGMPKDQGRIAAIGEGVVISVDRPENCLRIRRGPSTSYEIVGCAGFGERLRLTGVFSSDNRWAQLDNNGWVVLTQIRTDLRPPRAAVSTPTQTSLDDIPLVTEKPERRWREPATSYGPRPWGGHTHIWVGGYHKNQKKK